MKNTMKKRILAALLLSVSSLVFLAGCGKTDNKKSINVGVCAGPYGDMFREAIQPVLEEKGYTVEVTVFSDYVQPDIALAEGEIDANMFQNPIYLGTFKEEHGLDLEWVVEIPTAQMNVYSNTYSSLDEIPDGGKFGIPNDNTNILRSLRVLEQDGYIKLDPDLDPAAVTLDDILENPHGYEFTEVSAEVLPTVLDSVDAAIINGNYAIGAGLNLADAIYSENLPENYYNTITVRSEDVDAQFTKDIVSAIHSDSFRSVIEDESRQYYTFARPADYDVTE
ncbi:MAG: metal ABC transporter substrate-binding protein [Lachnospiraceae bacterium]|nr:metal ABC transporter substrate-binding protein [Lachnospiraceae bacterium]